MFAQRRERFMQEMKEGIAIIPAAQEAQRSNDTNFNFCQSKNFRYLTNFPEPDALALFMPQADKERFVLFVRPQDKSREVWDGIRYGAEGAREAFGADAAYTLDQLDEKLPQYLSNHGKLFYHFGKDHRFDQRLYGWLAQTKQANYRKGIKTPETYINPEPIIHELRVIKDSHDLTMMRKAAQLSVAAHRHAMKVTQPGMNEYQIQAELEFYCRYRGAQYQAYESIVASGNNTTILHYVQNNQEMKAGELLCVDFGCEYEGYASDITRTWPIDGRFSQEQRLIYDIVLEAHQEAIKLAQVGNAYEEMHQKAVRVLAEGLFELKILEGDIEKHINVCLNKESAEQFSDQPTLKDFYMHGTGHWIGLDVHDPGFYKQNEESRKLEAGMCFTIEPGLYFSKDNAKSPERFKGIGIRIEDDILVTPDGEAENLTAGLPLSADEVEACCAEG